MKLKCLNSNCNYNKDKECQNVSLYVHCFKLDELQADTFILNYLKNRNK